MHYTLITSSKVPVSPFVRLPDFKQDRRAQNVMGFAAETFVESLFMGQGGTD